MQKGYKDILFEILKVIHYPNDKEEFFFEFENLNKQEALVNLLEQLPTDIQEKVKNAPEDMKGVIPQEVYEKELIKVAGEALAKFIEDIYETLSGEQIEQIEKLFLKEPAQEPA